MRTNTWNQVPVLFHKYKYVRFFFVFSRIVVLTMRILQVRLDHTTMNPLSLLNRCCRGFWAPARSLPWQACELQAHIVFLWLAWCSFEFQSRRADIRRGKTAVDINDEISSGGNSSAVQVNIVYNSKEHQASQESLTWRPKAWHSRRNGLSSAWDLPSVAESRFPRNQSISRQVCTWYARRRICRPPKSEKQKQKGWFSWLRAARIPLHTAHLLLAHFCWWILRRRVLLNRATFKQE